MDGILIINKPKQYTSHDVVAKVKKICGEKYISTIQLGKKTDTLDSEGSILEERIVDGKLLNKENVQRVLECQIGKQIQTPPIYSAIKVNGKKLYEYARKGVEVEIPKREIEIYNIELLDINEKDKIIELELCVRILQKN